MHALPPKTMKLIELLKERGVNAILYGSQGVSLYIGPFKSFGDIDLLVADKLLTEDWPMLIGIMNNLGFRLTDEHEHEFKDAEVSTVAFAPISILIRDKIAHSASDVIQEIEINGNTIATLTPEGFLKAYAFSLKDGYRKEVRGKKDADVIALLSDYIQKD